MVVQVLRRVDLLQQALAHHGDARAHRHRFDLVVRDVDEGRAEAAVQLDQLGARLHTQFRVQVRERLVHQENLRLANDGATKRDALPLPAGQLLGLALQQVTDLQDVRGLLDALVDLLLGRLAQLQPKRHIVVHAHVRVERVRLEHHGDVAVFGRHVVDDPLADEDAPRGDLFQPRQQPQRGGLAAARRADQHQELLVFDIQ